MSIRLKGGTSAPEDAIQTLEKALGVRLSESVRAFVRVHNGAKPDSNIFTVSDNNSSEVRFFIAVDEILRQRAYIENVPSQAYPIAYDDCGNFILVDESRNGAVVFWDHELPDDMITLATDFGEFLHRLQPFDQTSVKLKPGQVKTVWIHPEFLKKLKNP